MSDGAEVSLKYFNFNRAVQSTKKHIINLTDKNGYA